MNAIYLKLRLQLDALLCKNALLRDYYQALNQQLSLPVSQMPFMAFDLEMTGLDSQQDQILSIGIVPIIAGELHLTKAKHLLVQIEGSVGNSAVIHGIVDDQLTHAVDIEQALQWFLEQTKGHILVAHHAPLDLCFLKAGYFRWLKQEVKLIAVDTMALEKKRLLRKHDVIQEGSLRLDACRSRYNLPVYAAHNAAVDALACGELLLAQMAAIAGKDELVLTDLLA
ncbi:exonuclease domain-containing protein [Shewanella fidelis]|uniref:DNA-directed DNA polymerase n=1 Tax=Shewanella fidelis TaxID=173509 RepID=A0AAW8NKV9_9GAMM|nr:exonuclease domain-containing protein [Shewanella fidelis]MDR8523492.1 exonuclease domain-containing protein [Shewanella fidelis]MDW4813275.1 exonuclease domain-containing protein [Shewanella fidelis]MDW4817353.1 exonuclease domain-containing protein [Shewanella fidelis]MDW4821291.1 exonuclease domain-containing protein [Shewanella fidelis]MDW4824631.1 exonuclease domain-containing protein [Shewanella fidelis]